LRLLGEVLVPVEASGRPLDPGLTHDHDPYREDAGANEGVAADDVEPSSDGGPVPP
jgi:hypothetical protein